MYLISSLARHVFGRRNRESGAETIWEFLHDSKVRTETEAGLPLSPEQSDKLVSQTATAMKKTDTASFVTSLIGRRSRRRAFIRTLSEGGAITAQVGPVACKAPRDGQGQWNAVPVSHCIPATASLGDSPIAELCPGDKKRDRFSSSAETVRGLVLYNGPRSKLIDAVL